MDRMRVRLGLLVVLLFLVVPNLAQARPSLDETPATVVAEPSVLARAWSWAVSVFTKAGSFIDPLGSGGSTPGTALPKTDAGSFIDPLGGW